MERLGGGEVRGGEIGGLSPPSGCPRLILRNTPLKISQTKTHRCKIPPTSYFSIFSDDIRKKGACVIPMLSAKKGTHETGLVRVR